MAHLVNRRGYESLEESYRDANGKPRKRVLAYYGKRRPMSLSQVDWGATLVGEPGEGAAAKAEWDAMAAAKSTAARAPQEPEQTAPQSDVSEPSSEPGSDASDAGEASSSEGEGNSDGGNNGEGGDT